MMTFDWQALEDRLFEQSTVVLRQFAAEHPEVLCSFFVYETNPAYGEFLLGFDSQESMRRSAQKDEQRQIAQREMMLKLEGSWHGAKFNLRSVRESSPDLGEFAYYPPYAELIWKELEELSMSEDYPQNDHAWEDTYIHGNVRIVLWKVVERLIASEAFAPLRLASPFRVGYQFHDDGHFITLRLLNWPAL